MSHEDTPLIAALLQRTASGDHAAFRALYDSQSGWLFGLAMRILHQPARASDAVHDAFVEVWQRAASFDPLRGSPKAWLGTLVRYRAIDILRRDGREETGITPPDIADEDASALDILLQSDDGRALRHCLDALGTRDRTIVMQAFFDGRTHAELATRWEAPLGTVKSWVRRALLSLRQCLDA